MGEVQEDGALAGPPICNSAGEAYLRQIALNAAIQVCPGSDWQEVIRAARDIYAFLKEG